MVSDVESHFYRQLYSHAARMKTDDLDYALCAHPSNKLNPQHIWRWCAWKCFGKWFKYLQNPTVTQCSITFFFFFSHLRHSWCFMEMRKTNDSTNNDHESSLWRQGHCTHRTSLQDFKEMPGTALKSKPHRDWLRPRGSWNDGYNMPWKLSRTKKCSIPVAQQTRHGKLCAVLKHRVRSSGVPFLNANIDRTSTCHAIINCTTETFTHVHPWSKPLRLLKWAIRMAQYLSYIWPVN